MSVSSQLKSDCRQARDTVAALIDFLDDRRDIDSSYRALLSYDLDRAMLEIPELDRAVDKAPAIGLLAPVSTVSDVLVGNLAGTRDGRTLGLLAGGAQRLPVVTGLLPKDDTLGLSGLVRLTHEDQGQAVLKAADTVGRMMDPATPTAQRRQKDTGIRIQILSLADVIMILARAYFTNVKGHGAAPRVADVIAAIERTLADDVTPAAQPGLAAHHIHDIRHYLDQRFRDHPRLTALTAAGYWEAFASAAPRATAEGRRRLASLLWGGLADFDTIYGELAGAIELLSHATDVICPIDAVRATPARVGWGEAHPFSILAAGTLLSGADAAGEMLEVRSKFGQPVAVARNILTALLREVTLTVEGDPSALLARTDVVHLPITCPAVVPRDMFARPLTIKHPDAAAEAPWLARALMQAKTLYLAESETSTFDLTGLIIHLDAAESLSAHFAPIVAQWIERTQGQTPQTRDVNDTTLFVAVDAPVAAESPIAPLHAFLRGVPRMSNWLDRWGVDSAFNNLFILGTAQRDVLSEPKRLEAKKQKRLPKSAPATSTAVATLATAVTDGLQSGQWLKHVRDAAVAVDEALNSADGGIIYLAQSVATIDYARAKRRQVSARLSDTRSLLADSVDRLLYASAPDANNDWRHRAALATQARLRTTSAEQRIGHLISALNPGERELGWLFERLVHDQNGVRDDGLLQRLAALDQLDETQAEKFAGRYATRVIEHWTRGMRLLALTPGAPQTHGFTETTFGHLIDELIIGAARADLQLRIAAGVTRALAAAPGAQAARAAMAASEVIAAFLSQLGFDSPWSSRHPRRRGTLGAPLFERSSASAPEDFATLQAGRITLQFAADWCEGFGLMTEENVASARGMRFEDSEFRELAELLSTLGVNTRERAL